MVRSAGKHNFWSQNSAFGFRNFPDAVHFPKCVHLYKVFKDSEFYEICAIKTVSDQIPNFLVLQLQQQNSHRKQRKIVYEYFTVVSKHFWATLGK